MWLELWELHTLQEHKSKWSLQKMKTKGGGKGGSG